MLRRKFLDTNNPSTVLVQRHQVLDFFPLSLGQEINAKTFRTENYLKDVIGLNERKQSTDHPITETESEGSKSEESKYVGGVKMLPPPKLTKIIPKVVEPAKP